MGITHSVHEEEHSHSNPLLGIIYFLTGVFALLIALRFIFILLGAQNTGFVNFVLRVTQPFVQPFYGIFGQSFVYGGARLEIESLLAILVLWVIASLLSAVFRMFH